MLLWTQLVSNVSQAVTTGTGCQPCQLENVLKRRKAAEDDHPVIAVHAM